MQRSTQSTHSTFTQPVHFPQTDLWHPQKNFAVLFCSQFSPLKDSCTYVYHDCDCNVTKGLL